MPQNITPAILNAANQVESDLEALSMSTRALLHILRAGQSAGGGGGGESYAVATATGWSDTSQSQRLGWRFTVGGSDLSVSTLRLYRSASGASENVRIHRQSDGALIAEATIANAVGYTIVAISPFTLSAGADYVVSSYASGTLRTVPRNPSVTYDAAVTYVGSVFGTSDSMPTSSSGNTYVWCDFGFEVL